MNLEPLIFSPPSSPSPSLWPSPFLPSLLSPILWPILPFLHHVRLSFLKLWANETLSLCLLPQTWLQQKMKLTLEFRLPLNSRLIYLTTHSTCPLRCPMGPSKMSGHKANHWSLTLLPHLLPHSFLHFWNPWFHFPIFHTNNLQGLLYYFLLICLQSVKYFLYYTFKNAQSHLLCFYHFGQSFHCPSPAILKCFPLLTAFSFFLSSVVISQEARVMSLQHQMLVVLCTQLYQNLSILTKKPNLAETSKALWPDPGLLRPHQHRTALTL